jgi:hypothetical protein
MVTWSALLLPSVISAVLVSSRAPHSHGRQVAQVRIQDAAERGRGALGDPQELAGARQVRDAFCKDGKEMASPEMQKKFVDGRTS